MSIHVGHYPHLCSCKSFTAVVLPLPPPPSLKDMYRIHLIVSCLAVIVGLTYTIPHFEQSCTPFVSHDPPCGYAPVILYMGDVPSRDVWTRIFRTVSTPRSTPKLKAAKPEKLKVRLTIDHISLQHFREE